MAEGVDDRQRLVFDNQVQPSVQIFPFVGAGGWVEDGPIRSRVPQAHHPRLRGSSNPPAVRAALATQQTSKTPIYRRDGITPGWRCRALRVGRKDGSEQNQQRQRGKSAEFFQFGPP